MQATQGPRVARSVSLHLLRRRLRFSGQPLPTLDRYAAGHSYALAGSEKRGPQLTINQPCSRLFNSNHPAVGRSPALGIRRPCPIMADPNTGPSSPTGRKVGLSGRRNYAEVAHSDCRQRPPLHHWLLPTQSEFLLGWRLNIQNPKVIVRRQSGRAKNECQRECEELEANFNHRIPSLVFLQGCRCRRRSMTESPPSGSFLGPASKRAHATSAIPSRRELSRLFQAC